MDRTQPLPRLVVVSLHKSGTHLALRLVEELGYQRRFFDERLIRSARQDPPETFLSSLEPGAAYFLHECRLDGFPPELLLHWRETNDPRFIFHYRDPRAVLLSQVNYLRRRHRRGSFSNTPYHLIFSDILQAVEQEGEALTRALHCMGDYLCQSFLGSVWMLQHPRVLPLSYERLAGASAGGSDADQLEQVEATLRHLDLAGDAAAIASRLYDPTQPTFHRGRVYGWRDVYTSAQVLLFEQRYAHLLDIYGYPRSELSQGRA